MKRIKLVTWFGIILFSVSLLAATFACSSPSTSPAPASKSATTAPAPVPTPTSSSQAAPAPSAAKTVALRALTYQPPNMPLQKVMSQLAETVKQKSKGEITITIVGGPEVVADVDQPDAVSRGVFDMAASVWDYIKPKLGDVVFAPNLVLPLAPEQRKSGIYDLLNEQAKRGNLKYLGHSMSPGPRYLITNKPVSRLENVAGLRIRSSGAEGDWVKAQKGSPMVMPWSEAYSAIDRGLLDGFFGSAMSAVAYSLHEVAKYRSPSMVSNGTLGIFMNLDKFKGLSEPQQKLLLDSMAEVEIWATGYLKKIDDEAVAVMEAKGVKYVDMAPADFKKYSDSFFEIAWQQIMKADPEWGAKIRKLAGS